MVEGLHFNLEVFGSNPVVVNFVLFNPLIINFVHVQKGVNLHGLWISFLLFECSMSLQGLKLPQDNKQLLHAVTGSMTFCTLEGEKGIRGEAEGAISPRGCTKPMDPSHSVQQLFCYTFV